VHGLNEKTLESGFKFKLENGLDATVYSMASRKVRPLINRQFKKGQWPNNQSRYVSPFLVVEVSVANEEIHLLYYAWSNDSKRATVHDLHTNLNSTNTRIYYAIYKGRLFFSHEHAMQAIREAVIKKVTPEIAITAYPQT
jgi:hypothetical protein